MSTDASRPNRLWVQVLPSCAGRAGAEKAMAIPPLVVANLVASGVGAIIKSTADRLIASDRYTINTMLVYEPGFVIRAQATTSSFLLNCITLNVGPHPIVVFDEEAPRPLALDELAEHHHYKSSPVVIRLEFDPSGDGTALAARVTHWKYTRFLDPSQPWFRDPRRKVTIEVKMLDPDGTAMLTTALQVEANSQQLPHACPNHGDRLPWAPKPVKNYPGNRQPERDQCFGPVNIEASITEVAEPSRFARIVGRVLGSQQAAIEGYLKGRINQALDESAAARASLATLQAASTARSDYELAYKAAVEARKAVDGATEDAARTAAEQALTLQLATLRLKEVLARAAFDRASLPFEPLPAIA